MPVIHRALGEGEPYATRLEEAAGAL